MVKKFYNGRWHDVPNRGSSGLNMSPGGFDTRRSYVNRKGSTGLLGSSKGSMFVSTRKPKRKESRSRSAGFFRGGKRGKFGSGFK